jgi:hypothetical protein
MSTCPNCQHELQRPPEDVQEWFRCDQCGIPLQLPSSHSKTLYWLSIFGVLLVATISPFLSRKYFPAHEFPTYLLGSCIVAIYGGLARLFWKTKLSRPRLFDPYSSLDLSDSREKLRGRR